MNLNKNLKKDKWIKIGLINNTHAIKGDIKLKLFPNNIEKFNFNELKIGDEIHIIQFIKNFKNGYLLHLKGKDNINDVLELVNKEVFIRDDFNDNEFFYYELIGSKVVDNKKEIGTIKNYFIQGNFYTIELNESDLTIPLISKFVLSYSKKNKILKVKFPEGFL